MKMVRQGNVELDGAVIVLDTEHCLVYRITSKTKNTRCDISANRSRVEVMFSSGENTDFDNSTKLEVMYPKEDLNHHWESTVYRCGNSFDVVLYRDFERDRTCERIEFKPPKPLSKLDLQFLQDTYQDANGFRYSKDEEGAESFRNDFRDELEADLHRRWEETRKLNRKEIEGRVEDLLHKFHESFPEGFYFTEKGDGRH